MQSAHSMSVSIHVHTDAKREILAYLQPYMQASTIHASAAGEECGGVESTRELEARM